jgi:hypothetical protein
MALRRPTARWCRHGLAGVGSGRSPIGSAQPGTGPARLGIGRAQTAQEVPGHMVEEWTLPAEPT